jgi:hypothetical protein
MFTIEIDDGFCKWKYTLTGSSNYSIKSLIDIIVANTELTVDENELVESHITDIFSGLI